MSTTVETTPTIEAPRGGGTGRKAAKVELTGQDLAERKFARKLIAPALVVAILITQIPFPWLVNIIWLPSGESSGAYNEPIALVNCFSPFPLISME